MVRESFPSQQLDSCQIPDAYGYSKGHYSSREEGDMETKTQWYGMKECVESGNINAYHQKNTIQENILMSKKQQYLISSSEFTSFNDLCCGIAPSPFQLCLEQHTNLAHIRSEVPELIAPQESYEISDSKAKFGQEQYDLFNLPSHDITCTNAGKKLVTNDFLRLGGEKFIQSSSLIVDSLGLSHPFITSIHGLSNEERRDVEIIQNLLASAEKVGERQFSRANNLLNHCHEYSSIKGTPVQRLVYYFSQALQQRIDHETGRRIRKDSGKMQSLVLKDTMMNPNPSLLASYQRVPFSQVILFTAMQMMIENVSDATKIHVIDFEIRNGLHFTILMEALAARSDCPLEHLRITAVGTISRHKIEDTGKRLMSVAQSLNLSFSFDIVMVADMLDINESHFKLNANETLAVYSSYIYSSMIGSPDRLETLMKVIQKINPCVMIVTEVEANHNSPLFVHRFIEALFYYGALFDSMEECMDRDDPDRMMSESILLSPAITNIVVFEGEERIIRHVNSNVWKAFFSRYGAVEIDLSTASLYQAKLLVDNFACASSCTFDMVGKSLAIGWRGTPIMSASALRFL